MDNIIRQAEDISLDEIDLKNIASPNELKIIMYQELHPIKDIRELFQMSNNIIVLYRTTGNYGHWVSLLNYDDHIEYFDSYGKKPDYGLMLSTESLRHMKDNPIPHISHLLKHANEKYGTKIIYNKVQLQRFHEHVNTCGRWASTRIKLRHLSLRKFQELFTSRSNKHNADSIVTYLTYLTVDKDIKELL